MTDSESRSITPAHTSRYWAGDLARFGGLGGGFCFVFLLFTILQSLCQYFCSSLW